MPPFGKWQGTVRHHTNHQSARHFFNIVYVRAAYIGEAFPAVETSAHIGIGCSFLCQQRPLFSGTPLEIKRHGRTVLRKISASDMCPDDSVFCHGGGPLRLYLCSSIGLCHSGQPFRQCWHTLQRHRTAVFRNAGNFFFQYHLGKTSRFAAHVQYGILWRTVLSSPIPVENRKCFFRDFPMASADSGSAYIVAGIADITAAISASRGNRACFSDHWAASLWAWLVGHAPEVLPPILHRAGRFRHGSSFAVDSPVQAVVSQNQHADHVHFASDLGRSVQLVYKTATGRVPAVDCGRAVPFGYAGNCFVGGGQHLSDRIYSAGIRFAGVVSTKNADPLCGDSNDRSYPDAAAAAAWDFGTAGKISRCRQRHSCCSVGLCPVGNAAPVSSGAVRIAVPSVPPESMCIR